MRTSMIATIVTLVSFVACASAQRPPNIIILFADDMAYADPACFGSKVNDTPHLEGSALFLHLNTNKQSVVLDLKSTLGREIALRLAAEVDIVVENFRPGVMADLGLDYESLRAVNENIILTSISNFGQTGPYRDLPASEITLSAMGGPMNVTGNKHAYPLKLGGNVVQYHAGATAANKAVSAKSFPRLNLRSSPSSARWTPLGLAPRALRWARCRP